MRTVQSSVTTETQLPVTLIGARRSNDAEPA